MTSENGSEEVVQRGSTWKQHLDLTQKRAPDFKWLLPLYGVRARPLYRVVGIIHIASGGVKVVILWGPRTRFFSFIYVLIQRGLLCVLDWSSFGLGATEVEQLNISLILKANSGRGEDW